MGQTKSQTSKSQTSKPQASKPQASKPQASGRRTRRSTAFRRPPEKGLARIAFRLRAGWESGLELWPIWTLLFLTVAVWCLLPRRLFEIPRVEQGSISTRTYIADRDLSVLNQTATAELKRQREAEVPPVYDFNAGLAAERISQLGILFHTGRDYLAAEQSTTESPPPQRTVENAEDAEAEGLVVPDLVQILTGASGLRLTAEEAEWLREREFTAEIEDRLAGLLRRIFDKGVVSDRALVLEHRTTGITVRKLPSGEEELQTELYRYLDYPDQVRETVEQEVRGWRRYTSRDRGLLADFVVANVAPNFTLNSSETLVKKTEARDGVGTVAHTTRKGEVIVRKGEEVEELAARTIAEMAGNRERMQLWLAGLGTLLLLLAALALIWLRTGLEIRRDRSRVRLYTECLILLGVHVVGVRFAFFVATAISGAIQTSPWNALEGYTFGIPFASLSLLSVLLYGRGMAFVLALVFALLVGLTAGGEAVWPMTFYSLASSLAAVFALDQIQFKQRSVMIRVAWVIGWTNGAAVVTLRALGGDTTGGFALLGFELLCALAGAFLAAALTSFAVPVFEALFSITTYIKLLELSNTNLPLLRRLALEAPGTFQHSIAVANLAKAGCEAIGLDSVLVHTSALYHDIGKVYRPHYFVENQAPGQNPHDKIQPSMSALILINHVKEGLELARKHGLPLPIFDAIEQHHGTQLIKFFYNRALERCDPETDEVREDEFRYPGPKPQSKEMGILMLADGVEAASRTLVEPSRQKIRGLLIKLLGAALEDHQLDQTDLTLGDLRRVEEAFLNVLTNIYHRRIDYPGFDFNRQPSPGKGKSGKISIAKLDAAAGKSAKPDEGSPAVDLRERKAS